MLLVTVLPLQDAQKRLHPLHQSQMHPAVDDALNKTDGRFNGPGVFVSSEFGVGFFENAGFLHLLPCR